MAVVDSGKGFYHLAMVSRSLVTTVVCDCQINQCFMATVVTCGKLPPPANGEVTWESTDFNSIARYTCNEGFDLRGASERVCLANGFWSERPPLCVPVPATANLDHTRPKSTITIKTSRPTEQPLGDTNDATMADQMPFTSPRPQTSQHQLPLTSGTPIVTTVPDADNSRPRDANVYIIWAMIALLICLIVLVVVLIVVVYFKKRKISEFDSAVSNSVENPVYSGMLVTIVMCGRA